MNTPPNRPTRASGAAGISRRGRGQPVIDEDLPTTALLHTPADAARLLAVPESWLRRKAGRRQIPCTFVGKHLRFSAANLAEITDTGAQTVRVARRGSRAA
jgi:excisionase family DNA binding protein